jgi:hypothetical protein
MARASTKALYLTPTEKQEFTRFVAASARLVERARNDKNVALSLLEEIGFSSKTTNPSKRTKTQTSASSRSKTSTRATPSSKGTGRAKVGASYKKTTAAKQKK